MSYVSMIKHNIESYKKEIALMEQDLILVSSEVSLKAIQERIDNHEKSLDRWEYKLWKLER